MLRSAHGFGTRALAQQLSWSNLFLTGPRRVMTKATINEIRAMGGPATPDWEPRATPDWEPKATAIEPFNLRLTRKPMVCVTGLTIPPGLVGFCWETPLCLEVLDQQAPELARVVKSWTDSLQPILEIEARQGEPSRVDRA